MNIDTSWTLLRGGSVLFDKRRGSRADVGLRVSEKENFLKFEKLDESCREDYRVSLLLNVSRKIGKNSRVT